MSDKLVFDVREVAKLLGVSPRSVWEWANNGKFPQPIALGRLRRWRLADVENWLAQQPTGKGAGDEAR